jgi:hypothetical protein
MDKKPTSQNSSSEREMQKIEKQLDTFNDQIQEMTLDRMNQAPKFEMENQTKISQQDLSKSKEIYLKPYKTIASQERFNENYRKAYEYDKEYVNFIAENKEIIGEELDLWTKPYAGVPAEEWKVPVNKPVWGPRYLAEQIKRCFYHRLVMRENVTTGIDHNAQYYGTMAVDTTLQRLDAIPVISKKSVFMGKNF